MMKRTLKSKLQYGLEYNGVVHTDFEIRLPLVKDTLAVVSKYNGLDNVENREFAISVEVMIRCLTVDNIPKEVLTYDFLIDNLVDEDFDLLNNTFDELKKKYRVSAVSSNTTEQHA